MRLSKICLLCLIPVSSVYARSSNMKTVQNGEALFIDSTRALVSCSPGFSSKALVSVSNEFGVIDGVDDSILLDGM